MSVNKETYKYKIGISYEIYADVFRTSTHNLPSPAIFWIHGGALIAGSRTSINSEQLDRYLSSGYTVVSIDYRLAPETKLESIIEDIRDAYRWIRESGPDLFYINPDCLAVIGHSAGGYLSLMTGFCVSPRPKALVSFYGYGDIISDWYTKPDLFYCQQPRVSQVEAYKAIGDRVLSEGSENRGLFYIYCRQQGLWPKEVSGHDPEAEASFFLPYCPIYNLSANYPPTLLLHGEKDTDVPYQQSIMMAKALDRFGVENHLITIPGGRHGFDEDIDNPIVQYALDAVISFLESHLTLLSAN
jgi:acetyl esterase/lipase